VTDVDAVRAAFRSKRHRYSNEIELHHSLAATLVEAGIEFEREVKIVGGRIDFLIGDLGVEVKVGGSAAALARQVARYTAEPRVGRILIVTTRPVHRAVHGTANEVVVDVLVIGALS
jgi:hypothetical protein